MKKILTVLTIVALVASSAFAGFSGEASVTAGANLDNGNFGFLSNGNNVKLDVELSTAEGSAQGEGDIYASIKGSLGIRLFNGEKGTDFFGDPKWGYDAKIGVVAKLDEAKIGGENWYVSIKGMPDGPDYASSAVDTYDVKDTVDKWGFTKADYTKNASVGVPYASTNGVEVGVMGFKAGLGLLGDYSTEDSWKLKDNINVAAFVETPEFDFDGLKLQVAGVYSYNTLDKIEKGAPKYVDEKQNALGGSVKIAFENDTLSASIASDMGVKFPVVDGDEAKFDADVAANFTYDFITVDAYYGTNPVTGESQKVYADYTIYDEQAFLDAMEKYMASNQPSGNPPKPSDYMKTVTGSPDWGKTDKTKTEDLLSAQVKFDLNSFDVPVALTVSAKDLLHTINFGVKAEIAVIEDLKLTAKAGYVVNTMDAYKDEYKDTGVFMGKWSAGLDAEYAFDFATVKGGVSLNNVGYANAVKNDGKFRDTDLVLKDQVNQVILGVNASVETTTLIPGATLTLAWSDADDLLRVYNKTTNGDFKNFGSITAKCKIAF